MSQPTIFKKIIDRQIPADIVYEDDQCLAFKDVNPQAPVHVLVIPKAHVATLYEVEMRHHEALGRMLVLAGEIARKAGAAEGFRTIINTGRVGHQEVYHVHMHVLGGPDPLGPMLHRK